MNKDQLPRRRFLKMGVAALTMIPLAVASSRASAATNAALRTSLKYKSTPEGDKCCVNCIQFVSGASPKDLGGCKVIPGDTEISPDGYCIVWAKKA